jgi:hypothetical protein
MLQEFEEQIIGNTRSGMAEMGVSINRWAADIHAHVPLMYGFEKLFCVRQGICKIELAHVLFS